MKVSVLVITHDRPNGLSLTLSGLSAQSRTPDEVVVIDNGSTVSYEGVVAYYRTALPMLYMRIDERTIAAARNCAIEKSNGDILMFTDDDCLPEDGWVAGLLAPFMHDENIGEVGGKIVSLQSQLNAITLVGDSTYKFMMKNYEHGLDALDIEVPYRAFFPTANAAFRRTVLASVGGFDPAMSTGEDIDISFRIIKTGRKLVYASEAVVRHKHRETIKDLVWQYWHYGDPHPHLYIKYSQIRGKMAFRIRTGSRDLSRKSFVTIHVPFFINGFVYLNGFIGHCFLFALLLLLVMYVATINGLCGIVLAVACVGLFIRRLYMHHIAMMQLRSINVLFMILEIITRAAISLSAFVNGIKRGMFFIN